MGFMDPALKQALSGALGDYLGTFASRAPSVTITWRAALIPGQAGTTLCPCYDTTGHRTTDPSDPACFGRGVLGGYATGVVLAASLIVGQGREVQTPEGFLQTQEGALLYLQDPLTPEQPVLKRDDLIIVAPDPLGVPANPDRRYTVVDQIEPVHLLGTTYVTRYWCSPLELGAVAYRVPPANTQAVPSGQHGTV